jgi:hypothetical protein
MRPYALVMGLFRRNTHGERTMNEKAEKYRATIIINNIPGPLDDAEAWVINTLTDALPGDDIDWHFVEIDEEPS